MSLLEVCYEQITENFWYAMFGEFKLIIDRNTGYFNATKLCQDGGRRFRDWTRNKTSKELLEFYSGVQAVRTNQEADNPLVSPSENSRWAGPMATYCVTGNQFDTISGTYVR